MEAVSVEEGRRRPPVSTWRLVLAAGLAFYLDASTLISVSVALPVWRDVYQLGVWQVGLLSGGLAFALAAGSVVGGWLGDRYGRGRIFTYDLVVLCAGTLMILAAREDVLLTCGVLVVGLAAGADVPVALAVIADSVPSTVWGKLAGATQLLWIVAVLVTLGLGFAVSGLGFRGTRLLVLHLALLAVLTLGLRLTLALGHGLLVGPRQVRETAVRSGPNLLPRLLQPDVRLPLLLTAAFYVCWNIAAGTLGSYGTYFLVTVTRLSQAAATALGLVAFLPALVMAALFVRLADTRWRDRLFVVAMIVQVVAFGVGALTGGRAMAGMVVLVVLYSLSNVFAGEAVYKVWSQLLLPDDVRATALGLSYGAARAVAATFLTFVPAIVVDHPAVVLWILTACVTASGLVGLATVRHRALSGLLRPASSPQD